MNTLKRRASLALVALALPLLVVTCTSSSEPSTVATAIVITPGADTLRAIGRTQQFQAVVNDQNGRPISTAVVTWTSSDTTVVKVVSGTGVATAVAVGAVQITATSGAANKTAAVTVLQVAAQISKVSGDAQTNTVGKALTQPLLVKVVDSTGTPIAGATVTFAVTTGAGSLGTPTPATGANGQAQTTWTLGPAAGNQGVSASVGGGAVPAAFSATATPGAAKSVSKQAGDGQTRSSGASVAIAPAVLVQDTFNNPVPGVTVTFSGKNGSSVTGGTQTTNASGVAAVGSWILGTVGTDSLVATVTGSGIAGNPVAFTATSTTVGAPANVAILVGNNQPGLEGYGVNVRPAVLVTDAGSGPVPNATVTFAVTGGGGSVTGGTATTNAAGMAQVGKWTLGGGAGVNTLTATVTGSGIAGNPITFTDTSVAPGYTIQIQFFGPAPSVAESAAVDSAVAKWQRIIYRPIQPITISEPAGTCAAGTPAINQTITNLLIQVKFDSIDGPNNILGEAGPCLVRANGTSAGLTAVGVIVLDTADVANLITNGLLNVVVLHEMSHVIGFGTLWGPPTPQYGIFANCLQDTSGVGNPQDTYFSCAKARAAFDSIGGTSYTGASLSPPGGNKVPVENCGASSPVGCGAGTVNSHWREPVFVNELMTGYVNAGANPLSLITVAAQEDLGYSVNYDAADSFVRTYTVPAAGSAGRVLLGDDIRHGPIYLVDVSGRVIGVRQR
ncbi:MAG TPA: leishmanolysin-related zinc metalloendopeptidase [Gemmatimonadales bacterium]|nr:leishmanolysin-related zinc metalloendopeptidase [Gemmatimonadales bacterium]